MIKGQCDRHGVVRLIFLNDALSCSKCVSGSDPKTLTEKQKREVILQKVIDKAKLLYNSGRITDLDAMVMGANEVLQLLEEEEKA